MWRVYDYLAGKIYIFNQERLLIYLRQFDDSYVYYEECLTVKPDQRVMIRVSGVISYSIQKVEMMCELTPYQRQQWNNLQ